MSESRSDKINLNDVLDKFSIFGRYHAVSAIYITLALIYDSIVVTNYIFVAEAVKYRCADVNLTRGNANESLFINNAQDTIDLCRVPETCTRWIYDNPDSFVGEFQLACQDWKRTLVGTIHSFGYMIGLPLAGALSDRFGRLPIVAMTGVITGVCGLVKSFMRSYWIYVVFEFLEATLGELHSPLFVLGLLFISVYFLLDESPRWLLIKGNTKAVVKNINKAAKINKLDKIENLEMLTCDIDATSNFRTAMIKTFKSGALMRSCLVCAIWWIVAVFVTHGLSINSVTLNGNKYINYALSSAMLLPSFIIANYIMEKFNRKLPLMFSFLACAVLCACQSFIPNNIYWLSISMHMISKLISCMLTTIIYYFTSELFPTYTRTSMYSFCSSLGRLGGVAAPLTPLLIVYWPGLPAMLFGVASLMGGLVTFLVPDTGKKALPDTVKQAETFFGEEKEKLTSRTEN